MKRFRGHVRVLLLPLILSGSFLASLVALGETRYTVKKNDTLTDIARKHGVNVPALMTLNRLDQPNRIRPGDVLRIPEHSARKTQMFFAAKLQSALDQVRVEPKRWRYIVIHHSATELGSAKGFDRYHREHGMENGLAYHFVIGNGHGMGDGEIAIGRRWTQQLDGGHLRSDALNEESLGICLVGNFDHERPSKRQLESLRKLTGYLMARCSLTSDAIKTHQQINPVFTRCPGRRFPAKEFLRDMKKAAS